MLKASQSSNATENASYLAIKSDTDILGDLKVEASEITLDKDTLDEDWKEVSFSQNFSSAPVVLSQITSDNETQAVTLRTKEVNSDGFKIAMQEEENNDGDHATESVHIIAIETGNTKFKNKKIIVGTQDDVEESLVTVSFGKSMSSPAILATMQTFNGTDPATLRYDNLTDSSVDLVVEEEQSADDETDHRKEIVGWVAIER